MLTVPFEQSSMSCMCVTCAATSQLTDGDYSHDFVMSHLTTPESVPTYYEKPDDCKQHINKARITCDSTIIASTGRSTAKRRKNRSFEIR